jgi:putative membrane protein
MLTDRRACALSTVVFLATVLPLSQSAAQDLAAAGSAATIAMAWREALGRWIWDPWAISALLLSAVWYTRGLLRLVGQGDMRRVVPPAAPIYFAAGFAIMTIALLSPLDGLSDALFSAHMIQHLLLLLVAAPLFVRSRLLLVLFWAFPLRIRKHLARLWLATPAWRRLVRFVEHPGTIWALSAAILCLWHLPGPYDWALHNEAIHTCEHLSFLVTAYAFWSLVTEPGRHRRLDLGTSIVFVVSSGVVGGFLGAVLTFASHPIYAGHAATTAQFGLTQMEDQQLAGLIMWVPASFVYLAAAAVLFVALLEEPQMKTVPRELGGT